MRTIAGYHELTRAVVMDSEFIETYTLEDAARTAMRSITAIPSGPGYVYRWENENAIDRDIRIHDVRNRVIPTYHSEFGPRRTVYCSPAYAGQQYDGTVLNAEEIAHHSQWHEELKQDNRPDGFYNGRALTPPRDIMHARVESILSIVDAQRGKSRLTNWKDHDATWDHIVATKSIDYKYGGLRGTCTHCSGSGWAPRPESVIDCAHCHGTGKEPSATACHSCGEEPGSNPTHCRACAHHINNVQA